MSAPKVSYSIPAFKKATKLWGELIGDPGVFSLESRIFHSISIGIIVLAAFYVPYNFFAGLHIASLSGLVFVGVFSWQFYISRFKNRAHSSTIFGLTGIIVFSVNYFTNAGINGSTDLIWPAYLLLVFAVVPYRHQALWLTIYVACFLALHLLEYYYPEWVQYPFEAGRGSLLTGLLLFQYQL